MDFGWLKDLIPSGGLAAAITGVIAVVAAFGALLIGARRAGGDAEKVDGYERHLREIEAIKRAADTRPAGSVSDDPYNRDNRDNHT